MVKRLLDEFNFTITEPINMHCDNQTVIRIARNSIHRDRIKYVKIDCHFTKDKLDGKVVNLLYTYAHNQIADVLGKTLSRIMIK